MSPRRKEARLHATATEARVRAPGETYATQPYPVLNYCNCNKYDKHNKKIFR